MKKRKLRFRLAALVLISISLLLFLGSFKVGGSVRNAGYKVVTVEEGDNLWNIVKNNCNNYRDIRKAIYDIKKINNLPSAVLTPGCKIKIPDSYINGSGI